MELLDPFFFRLVWRMGSARHVIEKERLIGCGRVQTAHVFDSFVGEIGGEVVSLLAYPRKDRGMIAVQVGSPLVGLPAHESVEILKSHPRRPLVERAGHTVLI